MAKMKEKEFSLIIPTINRKFEVDQLLRSIKNLEYPLNKIEVIIVDQNKDSFIDDLVTKYSKYFIIKHLKVSFKGTSRAKNYGLKYAEGKYIHFPDDDSFYEKNTLTKVYSEFKKIDVDAIAVKVIDPIKKTPALLKFSSEKQYVNCMNFFKLTIEFNVFWKREKFILLKGFDENLGVGTYFASEESGDIILRALKQNYKILYIPGIVIYHPDKRNPNPQKVYDYALGFGALFRKHIKMKNFCIFSYAFSYIGKSIIGMIIFYFFGKKEKFLKYKNRLFGVVRGFNEAKKIY